MLLGLALTQHCNLRCPHCIRDDVTRVSSLDVALVRAVLDDAMGLYGELRVSLTGGEPLLHPELGRIVDLLGERALPYTMVTNGWHLKRALPALDRHLPQAVRLSLSGATEEVHDAERGRGSFRHVLLGVALLVSCGVPAALSMLLDRRDRHQLRQAADLAEALGCLRIHFILPQPVPGSAARDSDLPPEEWLPIRREIEAMAAEPGRATGIALDFGAPSDGEEILCDSLAMRRIYVDAHGRLCSCCQLSDYGGNEHEVVADLRTERFSDAVVRLGVRLGEMRAATVPDATNPFDRFPCMRCARAGGKLGWLAAYPGSPWAGAAAGGPARIPVS